MEQNSEAKKWLAAMGVCVNVIVTVSEQFLGSQLQTETLFPTVTGGDFRTVGPLQAAIFIDELNLKGSRIRSFMHERQSGQEAH